MMLTHLCISPLQLICLISFSRVYNGGFPIKGVHGMMFLPTLQVTNLEVYRNEFFKIHFTLMSG